MEIFTEPLFEAINSNLASGVYYLGSGAASFDCTKIPDYESLTTDNFLIVATGTISTSAHGDAGGGPWNQYVDARYTPPTYSYDSKNGMLQINAASISVNGSVDSGHSCSESKSSREYKAYCVIGDIRLL